MGTTIRPQVSENNKYWISKHRYYELKHFCLQYPEWKRAYHALDEVCMSPTNLRIITSTTNIPGDPTAKCAIAKVQYFEKMNMVERAAVTADKELCSYILKGVTEGLSYDHLKTKLDMPCSKDMYYDRYRRFFWILSKDRE